MGNILSCNPFSRPSEEKRKTNYDEETKSQDPFRKGFIELMNELIEPKSNEERERLITQFIRQSGLPFQETESVLYRYVENPRTMIPFQDFKLEFLRNLLMCLKEPKLWKEREELLPALKTVKKSIPCIEVLSRSTRDLDCDLYYLMAHYFTQLVLKISSRAEFRNLLKYVKLPRKEREKYFYYIWPRQNRALGRAVTILEVILRRFEEDFNPQEKTAKFEETMSHLRNLIPAKFLIFNNNIFGNINGMTLFSERICLSEDIVSKSLAKESVLTAQCLVTIMHELGHRKRVVHRSDGYFFRFAPEIIDGQDVEKQLFGGVINFKTIPVRLCKEIIDPENYIGKRLAALKEALKNYLYSERRQNSNADDFKGCGFHIFKPTTDLEEYFKGHPDLLSFPDPNLRLDQQ